MPYEQLPLVNATLNALAFLLVMAGIAAIRARREILHKKLMLSACCVSALFLASYLTYHFGPVPERKFEGAGWTRPAYFAMLISHIALAAAVLPMIVNVVRLGWRDERARHRRWAKPTVAVWSYVSVTGVLIYLILYVWQ